MKIRICITTMTPELAYDAANHAIDHASGPVEVWIAANHCEIMRSRIHPCARLEVIEFADNEGVVPAMHALWSWARASQLACASCGDGLGRLVPQHEGAACVACVAGTYGLRGDAKDDILCFIHDDCRILEHGWDGRVVSVMSTQPDCDCIGLVGGTGIGADDIYKTPYRMIQLGRHNVHSAMVDAEAHGKRATGPMRIATADGCALFVRRSFLDQLGGWSTWWPEANHGYDNALACMLRRAKRAMWLLPVVFQHPSQLKLNLPSEFRNERGAQRYVERFGQDHEVHAKAHQRLYDTFRDVLPFHV